MTGASASAPGQVQLAKETWILGLQSKFTCDGMDMLTDAVWPLTDEKFNQFSDNSSSSRSPYFSATSSPSDGNTLHRLLLAVRPFFPVAPAFPSLNGLVGISFQLQHLSTTHWTSLFTGHKHTRALDMKIVPFLARQEQ